MIYKGDCLTVLKTLPDQSVNCCVTSPPYWGLRDYGSEGQLGLEKTPEEYVSKMVNVFREVRRVLLDDGTLWLNLGDSYANTGCDSSSVGGFTGERVRKKIAGINPNDSAQDSRPRKIPAGLKQKDLCGIPWRVAFALQADGWYLRQDIIWHKPNPMPESVTDRCTKAHEYIFLLSKSQKYYFDNEVIKEKAAYGLNSQDHRPPGIVRDKLYGYDSKEKKLRGRVVSKTANGVTIRHPKGKHGNLQQSPKTLVDFRNKRSVWTVTTKPFSGAHFATFPEDLITPCILAGCPQGGVVLDPFFGAGTTGVVAKKNNRNFIGIELNTEYIKIAEKRIENCQGMFI